MRTPTAEYNPIPEDRAYMLPQFSRDRELIAAWKRCFGRGLDTRHSFLAATFACATDLGRDFRLCDRGPGPIGAPWTNPGLADRWPAEKDRVGSMGRWAERYVCSQWSIHERAGRHMSGCSPSPGS